MRIIALVAAAAGLAAIPGVLFTSVAPVHELVERDTHANGGRGVVIASLVVVLLASVIAGVIAARTVAPLRALIQATRELAAGNLERRVTLGGGEELRALGVAFNDMAARLEQLVAERYRSEAELRHARNGALEASRLKSRFLANMSHELRTPLNGVVGMVALLRQSALDEEQREFAETIQSSAEHLLAIIGDILDFSKVESGALVLEEEELELGPTIEGMVELIGVGAQNRGLEIVCWIAPDVPQMVVGDRARIRQVLTNLLGNAVKFTERGEVVVHVEVESRGAGFVRLAISVADTGIGISAAARKHLFQPFVQADSSTTRRYGGTGLGLAISKQLVEAMHGRIRCDSTPGVGSVFSFTLELGCREPKVVRQRLVALPPPSALVLDPCRAARECLEEHLRSLGFDVQSFVDLAALRAYAEDPGPRAPSLLAIDPRVLEGDRRAAISSLRCLPPFADVPIVLVTPITLRGSLDPLLADPSLHVLKKPIRRAAVESTVRRVLDGRGVLGTWLEGQVSSSPSRAIEQLPTPDLVDAQTAAERVTRTVLVAEDNAVNQRVAMHMLKRLGFEPVVVGNGREAVTIVQERRFAFVLMDVQMPEMDGYEATAEIRKLEPVIGRVRIFAMTANAMEGDREFCLASGMDDYLSKPVTLRALSDLVARWPDAVEPVVPVSGQVTPVLAASA